MEELTISISGMSCGHCLNAVNQALAGLAGVRVDSVRMGRAELHFDSAVTDFASIVAAVEGAGYGATRL